MRPLGVRAFDLVLLITLTLCGAVFAAWLASLLGDRLPANDAYFGADVPRIVGNLVDPMTDYSRATVHPLGGLIDVAFQAFRKASGLGVTQSLVVLAAVNGGAFAGLLFTALRVWDAKPALAAAATVFGVSMPGFVYWAGIPEAHRWGAISVLLVIILARWRLKSPNGRQAHALAMFVIGFSMVVTNVAVWLLAKLDEPEPQPAGPVRALFARLPVLAFTALAGFGATVLGQYLSIWLLHNRSVGRMIDMVREVQYVRTDAVAPLGGLEALGLTPPGGTLSTLLSIAWLLLIAWSVIRLPAGRRFIGVFALFGVVLHSFYGRAEAFMFSPNYAVAGLISIALALVRSRPRIPAVGLLAVAMFMGPYNVDNQRLHFEATRKDWVVSSNGSSQWPEKPIQRL